MCLPLHRVPMPPRCWLHRSNPRCTAWEQNSSSYSHPGLDPTKKHSLLQRQTDLAVRAEVPPLISRTWRSCAPLESDQCLKLLTFHQYLFEFPGSNRMLE